MSWIYKQTAVTQLPDLTVGFVYKITNLTNNHFYIGKKIAQFKKTAYRMHLQKNGIKKRKKYVTYTESDWRVYTGSNTRLNTDIKVLGREHFRFEILHFCASKSQLSYRELEEQVLQQVLLRPDAYNEWISVKVTKQK